MCIEWYRIELYKIVSNRLAECRVSYRIVRLVYRYSPSEEPSSVGIVALWNLYELLLNLFINCGHFGLSSCLIFRT